MENRWLHLIWICLLILLCPACKFYDKKDAEDETDEEPVEETVPAEPFWQHITNAKGNSISVWTELNKNKDGDLIVWALYELNDTTESPYVNGLHVVHIKECLAYTNNLTEFKTLIKYGYNSAGDCESIEYEEDFTPVIPETIGYKIAKGVGKIETEFYPYNTHIYENDY